MQAEAFVIKFANGNVDGRLQTGNGSPAGSGHASLNRDAPKDGSFLETVAAAVQENVNKQATIIDTKNYEALLEDKPEIDLDPGIIQPEDKETLVSDLIAPTETVDSQTIVVHIAEIEPQLIETSPQIKVNLVDGAASHEPQIAAGEVVESAEERPLQLMRKPPQMESFLPSTPRAGKVQVGEDNVSDGKGNITTAEKGPTPKLDANSTISLDGLEETTAGKALTPEQVSASVVSRTEKQAKPARSEAAPTLRPVSGDQTTVGTQTPSPDQGTLQSEQSKYGDITSGTKATEKIQTFTGAKGGNPNETTVQADSSIEPKGLPQNDWNHSSQTRAERAAPPAETKALDEVPKQTQSSILQQIVERAHLQNTKNQPEIKIKLKPEFLGNMRMNITTDNQQVAIKIIAEVPVVKDVLEANLGQLKTELESQGLEIDSFDVSLEKDTERFEEKSAHTQHRKAKKSHEAFDLEHEDAQEDPSEELVTDEQRSNTTSIDYFI
jgi:flagellar hook-length control protein FliK